MKFLKKSILPALILALCLVLLPTAAEAATSGTCGDNLTWKLSSGTLTISGTGAMYDFNWQNPAPWESRSSSIKKVIIKPGVTTIGDCAFQSNQNLTSVTIPEGVTSIGTEAFYWCTELDGVILPQSLTTIKELAFYHCNNLDSIKIPHGVATIDARAFGMSGITEVTIPGSVTVWGDAAFAECYSLEKATIGEGVTTISFAAFIYAPLTQVTIPTTVTAIDQFAFDATRLTDVYYDGTWAQWRQIRIGADNQPLQDATWHGVITDTCGEDLTWSLDHDGTLTVTGTGPMDDYDWDNPGPWYAFRKQIKKVVIGDGVTTVGSNAFGDTTMMSDSAYENLTQVHFGSSLVSIGREAFAGCPVTAVALPDSLRSVGWSSFAGCYLLTDVDLGSGVEVIDICAFYECPLTQVTIPGSVKTIKHSAFMNTGIKTVEIPAGVTTIESYAFWCFRLKEIRVDPNNPNYASENGALLSKDKTLFIQGPCGVTGTYAIPEGVTTLGYNCFAEGHMSSLIIPDSVTTIGGRAFFQCEALTGVTMGSGVEYIEMQAFEYCVNLNQAYYPGTRDRWAQVVVDSYNEPLLAVLRCSDELLPGDMDQDAELTTDDAVYLLLHVLFGPEDYPIPAAYDLDTDGDTDTDTDDAVYLLLHILFGEEDYPLAS